MHDFQYVSGQLHCEEVHLADIAQSVGTPFYCYSHHTLVRHYNAFHTAFSSVDHLICYSAKANSNLAVLRTLLALGAGIDIVSGGELYRALKAGASPDKIVYSGVGKREDEIRYALETGILMFNVESVQELFSVDRVAGELGATARVAIRVNPDVDPCTHDYISTGLKKYKFGLAAERALYAYREARRLPNLLPIGVDCHIGSQVTELSVFVEALGILRGLVETLRGEGFGIHYFDVGGGLGIPYAEEDIPHPNEYGAAVIDTIGDRDCTIVLEPGRAIAGNAGVLVSRVLYTKEGEGKWFVVCDAAMNDLSRPSLYSAHHAILPVVEGSGKVIADVVGPICETGDFLARDRVVTGLQPGDLFAVMSAGAYGFTMSSNYNSRPRVPEVLVKGNRFWIVRHRESYEDLVKGEEIPEI